MTESHNFVISVEHATLNLFPHGFRTWARHYLKCRIDFRSPDSFSPVPYFLLCRAIELELKARHLEILRQKEVKDRFGHNLVQSYRALPKASQPLSDAEMGVLGTANLIYMGKGFEYFSVVDAATAFKRFPDLQVLDSIASKLIGHDS